MSYFGKFYLDKEKDIVVTLNKEADRLFYVLSTPNHGSGNLIRNLSKLFELPTDRGADGMLVIKDEIPCYVNGDNRIVYCMRLANTKVANIYQDGLIERRAYIPAIAKTLMSQTKDYTLDVSKTLVKTYILNELKFHSDLHTHRNANLSPDLLIAIGIDHQLRYPYYYVKKLNLKLTPEQRERVELQRLEVAEQYKDCGLSGKYLDRKIDDHTEINFADLILNNLYNASFNIPRIRASLAVMKDGQAVFTDLEKVYLYRYVFTKGNRAKDQIAIDESKVELIPDEDIIKALKQMKKDNESEAYRNNTLYQDILLWTARTYQKQGISYAEISDTALSRAKDAPATLREIHEIMPAIMAETGVLLRFLVALRRIPLTIIKGQETGGNYFIENLKVLAAVANDPYVAGSDFVGEEINDVLELSSVIAGIVKIAKDIPSYVLRVHAGENDSLPDNVLNSILCVEKALSKGQKFPHMRLGHGLYTAKLSSSKGKLLLDKLREHGVVLEFQISSNVRLNNLNEMEVHPLKQYLDKDVLCVQGTDGGALYGSDPLDEQLALEKMLELSYQDMLKMRKAEDHILEVSLKGFEEKSIQFKDRLQEFAKANGLLTVPYGELVAAYTSGRIEEEKLKELNIEMGPRRYDSNSELSDKIKPMPDYKIPVVIAGGSFNSATHTTKMQDSVLKVIDDFMAKADPHKYFFVIGPSLDGYEKYVLDKALGRFMVFAFVPNAMTDKECKKIRNSSAMVRVSIEASPFGAYKSFAFEIFKRRQSLILALDGNSAAANLIQDAKNSKYKSRTFINANSKTLRGKAESLQGYITLIKDGDSADEILRYGEKYYDALSDPEAQILKKKSLQNNFTFDSI